MNSGVPINNLKYLLKEIARRKVAFNSLNFFSRQNFLSSSKVYDLDPIVYDLFSFLQRILKDDIFWLKMYFVF